jgi:hypothetical protein
MSRPDGGPISNCQEIWIFRRFLRCDSKHERSYLELDVQKSHVRDCDAVPQIASEPYPTRDAIGTSSRGYVLASTPCEDDSVEEESFFDTYSLVSD